MQFFIKKMLGAKYAIIGVFLALAVLSAVFSFGVEINYDISDYLDEDTDTKSAMEIMEKEFSKTGNLQVMVRNVTADACKDIKKQFENIENVLTVQFDSEDPQYYVGNNALFSLLIDGDDYSENAEAVISELKEIIEESDMDAIIAGNAMEKSVQRQSITKQIPYILVICLAIAYFILVVTTKSWLGPILFLLTAGVAVVINRGTNAIFGSISYITNSISAILQLALSLDYSIMLLHAYNKKRADGTDMRDAMTKSVIECIKPISASALTTIAGLLALLFMSFRIGFDIGIVLMKGIVISAIVSFTLFPCVLLCFDKILGRTKANLFKKKDPVQNTGGCVNRPSAADRLSGIAVKRSGVISLSVALLITLAAVGHTYTLYTYTEKKPEATDIIDTFGKSNMLAVVFEKDGDSAEKEKKLINAIENYKTPSGASVFKNYTSYSNTVLAEYDVAKAVKELSVSEDDAKLLFALYHLDRDADLCRMTAVEFLREAERLLKEDEDARGMTDEETVLTVERLSSVYGILCSDNTCSAFIESMSEGAMAGMAAFDKSAVKQLYGTYLYNEISSPAVPFRMMLDFIITASSENDKVSAMVGGSTSLQLILLRAGINRFLSDAGRNIPPADFRSVLASDYDLSLSGEQVAEIYAAYGLENSLTEAIEFPLICLLDYMNRNDMIADTQKGEQIESQYLLYRSVLSSCTYDGFLPTLSQIVYGLRGSAVDTDISDEAVQQLYILYFDKAGMLPDKAVNGYEFISNSLRLCKENAFFANQVTDGELAKLEDMLAVYRTFSSEDRYNYKALCGVLRELQNSVSISSGNKLTEDTVSGVYVKYAVAGGEDFAQAPVTAKDLVTFLLEKMDTNGLLKQKLPADKRQQITDAAEKIEQAETLFNGGEHGRLLLTVDLTAGSEESYQFIKFLNAEVKETFGEAYAAGDIAATYDLKTSFSSDNLLISVFTVIALLIIVSVTFRSLSVPLLLVAVIQGSIWISLSVFAMGNRPIFFMSYIVANCILMGATIDYGILMATGYVENRGRLGMDKRESLRNAVSMALPTVLSSGSVLTCCGFVICLISGQESIATVGLILGVGTVSSILMILFALPSILYLCDKIIMKTTRKKKGQIAK